MHARGKGQRRAARLALQPRSLAASTTTTSNGLFGTRSRNNSAPGGMHYETRPTAVEIKQCSAAILNKIPFGDSVTYTSFASRAISALSLIPALVNIARGKISEPQRDDVAKNYGFRARAISFLNGEYTFYRAYAAMPFAMIDDEFGSASVSKLVKLQGEKPFALREGNKLYAEAREEYGAAQRNRRLVANGLLQDDGVVEFRLDSDEKCSSGLNETPRKLWQELQSSSSTTPTAYDLNNAVTPGKSAGDSSSSSSSSSEGKRIDLTPVRNSVRTKVASSNDDKESADFAKSRGQLGEHGDAAGSGAPASDSGDDDGRQAGIMAFDYDDFPCCEEWLLEQLQGAANSEIDLIFVVRRREHLLANRLLARFITSCLTDAERSAIPGASTLAMGETRGANSKSIMSATSTV